MPSRNRVAAPVGDAAPDLKILFSELVRLETELWDAVEERLKKDHGVNLPTYEFVQVISRVRDCRVQDIAAELSITVGGTSKIVDRIEAAGLCARRANPSDRRSSIIELTPPGKRLASRAAATVDDELRKRIGTAMPERSLAQFTKTLTKLRSAVRSSGATEAAAESA
ncbi:MAG TPA: MarR family winged helix-turn-helix transcriptional regulator [Trebonia sp.]|jgi:DNA-binding MarR family transcriptional regulator|nr:MarR family winged helix-turn-helix transcriptional regulator [Trebonia sp.]